MTLSGFRGVQRKLERIQRDLGDEVADAVEDGGEDVADEAKRNVAQQNAVWRGNLYSSIRAESVPAKDVEARIVISANVPYAAYVEYGTGQRGAGSDGFGQFNVLSFDSPEQTPEFTRAITEWVMTKPVFYGERSTAVAWAIARSIAENGTHAQPYMRPAWFKKKPAVVKRAGYAAKRVVRQS